MNKCKAQLFLPQYFRVVLNHLGLEAGPQGAKAPKATKVSHSALTFANSPSYTLYFLFRSSARVSRLIRLQASSTHFPPT